MAKALRRCCGIGMVLALCAAPLAAHAAQAPLPAVSQGERTLQLTLPEWMKGLGVPGVGIAVINDYRIVRTEAHGVATPTTLFQAASVAKPVTALAVLRQVQDGAWDLDDDINDHLTSWQLPASEVQAGEKVTLRRLLAHTAGITPGGFMGYAPGAPLPNLVQVLDGAAPANNAPARVLAKPGEAVAYSGLGYSMLQLALQDQAGKPFEELMQDSVLGPLGMHDSSFAQPLPEAMQPRAARGHLGVGAPVEGGWRLHPEQAAAGLWTTPSDLATLAIHAARQMQTPRRDDLRLAFVVREGESQGYFAHSGGNVGYFAHVEMLADTGQGIVIMANAEGGQALAALLIASVAREFDWPLADRKVVEGVRAERLFAQFDRVANQRVKVAVDPAVLARYVGKYQLTPEMMFDISLADGQLRLQLGEQPRFPLFAESPVKFFLEAVDAQVSFVVDATGKATALVLHQGGRDQPAPRVE